MHSHTQHVSGVHRVAAGLLMAALGAVGPAPVQQATAQPMAVPAPLAPDSPPRSGSTLERHIESLRQDFLQLDADLDGKITQRDVDVHVLMESVMQRHYALHFVLRYDLDGDGTVTEDEIRRAMRYNLRWSPKEIQKEIDDVVRSMMGLDTDKDGKVSVTEAGKYTYPQMQRDLGFPGISARTRQALTRESSTKGKITWQEYEAAGDVLFRKVDTDRDGKISQQELDDYRKAR